MRSTSSSLRSPRGGLELEVAADRAELGDAHLAEVGDVEVVALARGLDLLLLLELADGGAEGRIAVGGGADGCGSAGRAAGRGLASGRGHPAMVSGRRAGRTLGGPRRASGSHGVRAGCARSTGRGAGAGRDAWSISPRPVATSTRSRVDDRPVRATHARAGVGPWDLVGRAGSASGTDRTATPSTANPEEPACAPASTAADLPDLIDGTDIGVLATRRPDDSIMLSPVWWEWRDGGVNIWVDAETDRKIQHIRRDPRVDLRRRRPRSGRTRASRSAARRRSSGDDFYGVLRRTAERFDGPEAAERMVSTYAPGARHPDRAGRHPRLGVRGLSRMALI